jgi:hypothetical protein
LVSNDVHSYWHKQFPRSKITARITDLPNKERFYNQSHHQPRISFDLLDEVASRVRTQGTAVISNYFLNMTKYKVYSLCEAVADIAFIAAKENYKTEDSREKFAQFIEWAKSLNY